MRRLGVRAFRGQFHQLTDPEPIEVMNHSRTIGFYYPGETPPIVSQVMHRMADPIVMEDDWIPHITASPAPSEEVLERWRERGLITKKEIHHGSEDQSG